MLAITGWNSQIVIELRGLLDDEEDCIRATYDAMPLDADRYFFCAGLLLPKRIEEMTGEEYIKTFAVNYSYPMLACESIFEANPRARICVMGSESGYSGSYNMLYASAKKALHKYVETKKLKPDQQLVCVSPGIIGNAGMTMRRTDTVVLAVREAKHPKQRFVTSLEVARLVRFLLYEDQGYICNTVIRMNGGEHTR
jgi:NAD(P)-dependent dehydrogenase (short-subunit alcohol dehydrogenase family)